MTLHELFSVCLHIPYATVGLSANYAVKREGATLYIFFQDSDGKNDWKINLDFPAKPYRHMDKPTWFAHRGFARTWKEIEPFLAPEIADKSVNEVVIAGYSHGGALAMLCHEYVWYHRPDLRDRLMGYGFGAPRVFWGRRTAALKERWKRFTVVRNLNDIVTRLPPAVLGFAHMGTLLKIGEKGKYSSIQAHFAENILTELKIYDEELH